MLKNVPLIKTREQNNLAKDALRTKVKKARVDKEIKCKTQMLSRVFNPDN